MQDGKKQCLFRWHRSGQKVQQQEEKAMERLTEVAGSKKIGREPGKR